LHLLSDSLAQQPSKPVSLMKSKSWLRTRGMTALTILSTASAALLACASSEEEIDASDQAATSSWEAERRSREDKVSRYLAQNPRDFDWFKNSPIGFNGVPYVLLRVLVEQYPEVWPKDFLGFAPHPDDYGPDGKLKPEAQREHKLPYGFGFKDVAMNPNATTENVFFSCGACHTGRVIVGGKIKHIYGAPNTEIDPQMYTALIMQTVGKLFDLSTQPPTPRADQIQAVFANLTQKDPAWFYGPGEVEKAKKQVAIVVAAKDKILTGLAGSAAKGKLIYQDLPGLTGSYGPKDGKNAPPVFGPRPGQMDAYGIASGLVFLHSKRPDLSFFANLPDDHPYFEGLPATQTKEEKFKLAAQRLQATAKDWMPHDPAPVDIKSLYSLADRHHAGWDGNQGAEARVIASGTSAVADPTMLNLSVHETMNTFLGDLPPPPYPFAVNMTRALKGKAIYERECATCHAPNNATVYKVSELEVDANRTKVVSPTARLGLIALMRESCRGNAWCTPQGDRARQDDEFLRVTRTEAEAGYKADVLHGIWSQAPYLHNGSVPTLWHLLHPSERPARFVRGNINYDEKKVGFVWDAKPAAGSYDNVRAYDYDTTLRGQSNGGHTYGADLAETDKTALLEYLKTL